MGFTEIQIIFFEGIDTKLFSKILNICIKDNLFLFNGEAYVQVDGAPMGGCLSPSLADIFLAYHEKIWLDQCPSDFKPLLYRRYVDDTCVIFKSADHVLPFLNYLNSRHRAIEFTYETEKDNSIPFLNIKITKCNQSFKTTVYRKPTFTGLTMKFDSACNNKFNILSGFIHRAYRICNNPYDLNLELENVTRILSQNKFPLQYVKNGISKTLAKLKDKPEPMLTVSKKDFFITLPFVSFESNRNVENNLKALIKKFYPQLNLVILFKNPLNIQSLFHFKDRIPDLLKSNVVYKYECAQCDASYIGETTRHLKTRAAEHRGVSARTGKPISRSHSNILEHAMITGHNVLEQNFKIITTTQPDVLRISESIHIKEKAPNLNSQDSSQPLNIL